MNILVLANRDLASNYALNLLLPALQQHKLRLMLSSAVGGSRARPEPLELLQFFEQRLFNDLLFPLLDRAGSGGFHSFSGLRQMLAADPVIENTINSAESVARLREAPPDLILSIRYGGILKEAVIGIPRYGVINLHSGLLPGYRGVMASFWAMLAGEQQLGTTLHTIDDSSIDTGRVIATSTVPLQPGMSYLWQVLNLYPAGVQNMLQAVSTLSAGSLLQSRPQGEGGSYFSFPTASDLQAFADAGYRLYSADEIIEFVEEHYLHGH
mgnify:CR=1 FL=1